jgi:stearoyl-CoA desaturase (Delta-9 desaturase)
MEHVFKKASWAESHKQHISELPWTIRNWYKHINWLNTNTIITLPIVGLVLAIFTPLHTATAIWAIMYYFMTGLGITAGQ